MNYFNQNIFYSISQSIRNWTKVANPIIQSLKKPEILFYSFATLFLLLLLLDVITNKNSNSIHEKNVSKIEHYLQSQKEKTLQWFANIVAKSASKEDLLNHIQSDQKKLSLPIAVYANDTAIFWSDIDVVPSVLKTNNLSDIVFTNNTWAYLLTKKYNTVVIAVFVPIKKEYPFENNYLQNYFYEPLQLDYDYKISLLPEPSSYYVLNDKGTFLFSIQPVKPLYSDNQIALFVGILIILLLLLHGMLLFVKRYRIKYFFLTSLLAFISLRALMQLNHWPAFLYSTKWFSPELYTSYLFFVSLGDALLNSWTLLIIIEFFIITFSSRLLKNWWFVVWFCLLWFGSGLSWFYLWKSLIFESNIDFHLFNLSSLSPATVFAYLIIGLYAWLFFRISHVLLIFLKKRYPLQKVLLFFLIALSLFFILFWTIKHPFTIGIIFFILTLLLMLIGKKPHFSWFVLLILLISSFIVIHTYFLYNNKKENIRQLVALSLANEKDVVAQMLLTDMESRLSQDKILLGMLNKAYDNRYEIFQYLKNNYFYGYWNLYDLQVTICSNFDNLRLMPSGNIIRCFDYFNQIIQTKCSSFGSDYFYSLSSDDGQISFIGKFSFPFAFPVDSSEKTIYIELTSKPALQMPGYPDILMDSKTYNSLHKQWKNYAKYKNNQLIQQSGDFTYPLTYSFPQPIKGSYLKHEDDRFVHLLYAPNTKTTIVLTERKVSLYQLAWSVLYAFNLYLLLFAIFYGIYYLVRHKQSFVYGFRFKYVSSFLLILITSYLLISSYTLFFFNSRYQEKNKNELLIKNKTMINHLYEQLGNWSSLFSLSRNDLTKNLIITSNTFYADVNIYLPNGLLYATSRPAFFEKGLKTGLIDYSVWKAIKQQQLQQLIKEEKIGNLDYYSSYTALTDNQKIVAILQFPYFTEREKTQQEVREVIFNILNIYLLFIFISFSIALLIANGILRPISLLQNYFKKVRFASAIQPIVYNEEDEIKPLVNEYNRMLEELARSTEKLLLSERESAWRDVARQIAHEIKNPLTPMKLNIQYLLKQKKEKGYIPDEMLQNTMRILLEQIDSLATISSAFSTFSKMPEPVLENLDLVEEINKAVHLFSSAETEIPFYTNSIKKCTIIGDKEYIQRILNNLLTNAIQAIPPERAKDISVSLSMETNRIKIAIHDNGIGISQEVAPHIFKPRFTTKSSGMGMGLSLVKNMTEIMKGEISFTSTENIGTTFYLTFPIQEIEYEHSAF